LKKKWGLSLSPIFAINSRTLSGMFGPVIVSFFQIIATGVTFVICFLIRWVIPFVITKTVPTIIRTVPQIPELFQSLFF
jgi:hypothetical protein